MGHDKDRRSAQFRIAYWDRTIEMAGLMDGEGQQQLRSNGGEGILGRKQQRQLEAAIAAHTGTLRLEQVDLVAKRYALWCVRRWRDWRRAGLEGPEEIRELDQTTGDGMWTLDVVLRRRLEALLLSDGDDVQRALDLRHSIETEAGRLGANLDRAAMAPIGAGDWDEVRRHFDPVCNELNELLTDAGSPRVD